jgi:tripartite-type tricarboxylate transporter receptor subunit TctC
MLSRRLLTAAFSAAVLALALGGPADAQKYPERPITLIVPWAAGGGADIVSRILAAGLEKELGQPVNVVNRTGGSGVTGHTAIMTAAPDGYTMGVTTAEIATFKTIGLSDMTPDSFDIVSRIVTFPSGITVQTDGPYKTAADVIAAIKSAQKAQLSASGTGPGGAWHLAAAGLSKAAGVSADQIKFIPSQGGAPALQELAAGQLSFLTVSPIEAKALADAGKVKVLAIMDGRRMASMPDVPTLKEATGLGWEYLNWFALSLPKGVPADVRAKIAEVAKKAHARDDVQTPMKERGITPVWETSEEARAYAAKFGTTAGQLLKELGLAKE